MKNNNKNEIFDKNLEYSLALTSEELAYLAGFLDGDGCILVQIVKGAYKYKYTIRLALVFYQSKKRYWFMMQLKKKLKYGSLRVRKDNMVEYSIRGDILIYHILKALLPFLWMKKSLGKLVLEIITKKKAVASEVDFIEVCKLVDKVAEFTDSKKRTITSFVVKKALESPVETES